MTLTDEMLLRYADGTLSSAEARAVEDLLESDEVAAERLRFLRASGAALYSARDHDLAGAPIERALTLIRESGRGAVPGRASRVLGARPADDWARPWRTAAGIALFAAGLALGRAFIPAPEGQVPPMQVAERPGAGGWIEKVAEYQSLYSRATVESVHVYPDALPGLEARLATALGAPMRIPNLDDANLDFREGRELEFKGKTIVQLVYLPKNSGKPVALCAIKKPVEDFAPRFLTEYGLGIVQWAHGGVEFLLVGEQPRDELEAAARTAMARL